MFDSDGYVDICYNFDSEFFLVIGGRKILLVFYLLFFFVKRKLD